MALQVGQESKKTLSLHCKRKSYTNPNDNTTKEYNTYYVVVNGIPISVQVPFKDTTGRAVIENYFNE